MLATKSLNLIKRYLVIKFFTKNKILLNVNQFPFKAEFGYQKQVKLNCKHEESDITREE